MTAHGVHHFLRKSPARNHLAADDRMIDFKRPRFDRAESAVIALDQVNDLQIAVAVRAPKRDHADVLDQRRHERLVGIAALVQQCNLAGGRCGINRASPVTQEVEAHLVRAAAIDRVREAESEHERLDRLQTEECKRLLN